MPIPNEAEKNSADEVLVTEETNEFDWISKTFYRGSLNVYEDSAGESDKESVESQSCNDGKKVKGTINDESTEILAHTNSDREFADGEGDRDWSAGDVGVNAGDEGRIADTGGEGDKDGMVVTGDVGVNAGDEGRIADTGGEGDKDGMVVTGDVGVNAGDEGRIVDTGGEGDKDGMVVTGDVGVGDGVVGDREGHERMRKKRSRVVMDDEDEDDLNSVGVSGTPTKRRRLQRTSAVATEATFAPLFGRSSVTNQAILQCQLIANVREMRIGVELLRDAFCAAATGELLITSRTRRDVYCLIRQLFSTYSSITSSTYFQSLPTSDFLSKLLDEVRKMYTDNREIYLSVRKTLDYTNFCKREVIKDEYNLTIVDITKTITRLWNEMSRLSWNNLAAVDNRNIGKKCIK